MAALRRPLVACPHCTTYSPKVDVSNCRREDGAHHTDQCAAVEYGWGTMGTVFQFVALLKGLEANFVATKNGGRCKVSVQESSTVIPATKHTTTVGTPIA